MGVMTLIGHNGSVTDLKFDQYRLITSSDDGSIILWHLDSMKKYKPHISKNKKYEQANERYTFFPTTKEEQKNDDDNDDDVDAEEQKSPILDAMTTEDDDDRESDSSVSTTQSIQKNDNNKLQLNNLFNLNENWNMNGTKLSAWRHSFISSFGQSMKNKLNLLNKKKDKKMHFHNTNSIQKLQNHHYSKDLNFKRLSFQGHGGPIWALDFDNELLVSGSYDKCIKIWNISNANCRATLRGHSEWVSGIKLSQKYILSCSWDASIRLWKLDDTRYSGKCISTLQSASGNAIYCIQWSRDKNFIVSGCRHQAVQVWDTRKSKMIKTFMGHTKQVYCLQMTNNLILSGSADRSIKMWD